MNVTKKNLLEILGAVCVAALFAASAMHIAAVAAGAAVSVNRIYLIALCAAVFTGGCVFGNDPVSRKARKAAAESGAKNAHTGRMWGILAAIAGAAGVVILSAGSVKTLLECAKSAQPAFSDYLPFVLCAGTALLSAAGFGVCRIRGAVYVMALVFFMLMLSAYSAVEGFNVWIALPGLAALVAMYAVCASDKGTALRTLISSALIVALIATACLPGENAVWKPLNDAAQKARVMFEDYFKFTHSRVAYSLYMDGYQPLGDMLGGPAQPTEDAVMRVETTDEIYLRGTIKNTYTGYSWTDNAVKSRYLYRDPMRSGVKNAVFGTENISEDAFRRVQADIEFLSEGTSTLFVPHRTESISAPVAMAVYFNSVGEVFLPHRVEAGDAYSVTAWVPASEDAVRRLSGSGDTDEADEALLELPAGVDARVHALAAQITANLSGDYEKASAICEYLKNNYSYTLDGAYGNRDRDFVTAFLFDWQEGYCTYFASAMAVLARSAGLPSRYVEGYHVPANPDGETIVTGINAHAWAEVWIDGAGWIVFDATPGSEAANGDDAQNNAEPDPTPTPTPTPDGSEPTPTPETDEQTATPPPEDNSHQAPTPTPDWGERPHEPPENNSGDTNDSDSDADLAWLWWLLLALALLAAVGMLVRMRLAASDPARASAAQEDDETRLLIWYRALLTVFASEGQLPDSGETPAMFAHRMRTAGLATESFEKFTDAVMKNRYAGKNVSNEALLMAQRAYDELVSQLQPSEKMRWLRRRLISGFGDIRRIP